jgi:hypothetical protein
LALRGTENELLLDRAAHPKVAAFCARASAGANAVAIVRLGKGRISADTASEHEHSGNKWN